VGVAVTRLAVDITQNMGEVAVEVGRQWVEVLYTVLAVVQAGAVMQAENGVFRKLVVVLLLVNLLPLA